MTILKENEIVTIIDADYDGFFKVISPTNITQSLVKSKKFILVALIEPIDMDKFKEFLFKQTGIDARDDQENVHISIEPHRLQLAEPLS